MMLALSCHSKNLVSVDIASRSEHDAGLQSLFAQLRVCARWGAARCIAIEVSGKQWVDVSAPLHVNGNRAPLYFIYHGKGALDLFSFTLV